MGPFENYFDGMPAPYAFKSKWKAKQAVREGDTMIDVSDFKAIVLGAMIILVIMVSKIDGDRMESEVSHRFSETQSIWHDPAGMWFQLPQSA